MLRAPSSSAASIFRAATTRWASASPRAPSRAAPMLPSSNDNKMMFSTIPLSLDDSTTITSHDRTVFPGAATAIATSAASTMSIKIVVNYFMVSTSNNYNYVMTKFFRGGDLTWSTTSSSSSPSTVASASSGRMQMGTSLDERRMEERAADGKLLEDDAAWENVVPFTTVSKSSTTSTTTTMDSVSGLLDTLSIWQISTLKRRKKMMNKHKLQKRRKKLRLKTRK